MHYISTRILWKLDIFFLFLGYLSPTYKNPKCLLILSSCHDFSKEMGLTRLCAPSKKLPLSNWLPPTKREKFLNSRIAT